MCSQTSLVIHVPIISLSLSCSSFMCSECLLRAFVGRLGEAFLMLSLYENMIPFRAIQTLEKLGHI